MKNLKKKVISIWQLEDCDGNYQGFVNIEDAFEAATEMIKTCNADLEDKAQMYEDLARSFIDREKWGSKGFFVDEFFWCYPIDLMLDEYEETTEKEDGGE